MARSSRDEWDRTQVASSTEERGDLLCDGAIVRAVGAAPVEHRDGSLPRDEREARIRVDDARVSDPREQREVGDAVRVEVAVLERDALARGVGFGELDLAAPERDRMDEPAGEPTLFDDEARAEVIVEPEVLRRRRGLIARRRGHEHEPV